MNELENCRETVQQLKAKLKKISSKKKNLKEKISEIALKNSAELETLNKKINEQSYELISLSDIKISLELSNKKNIEMKQNSDDK